jgi:phenylalanyl-tRNA synthetase beta chain
MFVSYRWLARHVDLEGLSPQALAEDLTLSTCEVEGVEPFAPQLADVVVGLVTERVQHPNADKLSVCTVDVGAGEPLQIVCGASNVDAGKRVAVATVGTRLPGDFKIKKSKIRGVESRGMICSERELELGDEHSGIWVLPESAQVGAPVREALDLDDWVLEIDNKSLTHRPDLWGHRGLAGEVAAITGRELKPLDLGPPETGDGAPFPLRVESEACPRYVALVIDGVTGGPSPLWLKMLLLAAGQRPLDLLVDLSNFVMLDLGQPNHTFDCAALSSEGIVVRGAREGEAMATLDGEQRCLLPSDLLICSGDEPVALAGVMGGEGSKVEAGTGSLLLEVASFDPAVVRRTSSRLGLRTDASTRFEKHLDPTLPLKAAGHFARLLRELQPDVTFPARVSDEGQWTDPAHTLKLRPARVRLALGAEISDETQIDLLRRIGFGVRQEGEVLAVDVPSARATKDVTIEQDLVEEVGRLHRYGNVPEAEMSAPIRPPTADPRRRLVRAIGDHLARAARFHEVLSYSFQPDDLHAKLGLDGQPYLTVTNPVAEGVSRVRRDVLPSLLGLLASNRRHRNEVCTFEIGKGYRPEEGNDRGEPGEVHQVGLAWAGPRLDSNADYGAARLWRLRGVLEDLIRELGLEPVTWTVPAAPPSWAHPAKCLEARWGDESVGVLAELEPGVARALGLEGELASDVGAAQLSIDVLLAGPQRPPGYRPIPRFPAIKVDVAVLAPDDLPAGDLAASIEAAGKGVVRSLELFDLYRGDSLGAGRKSLAWHVVLQSEKKTLTDKDGAKFLGRVERAVAELGAQLRTG